MTNHISRRQFIKAAAGASVGWPLLVPSCRGEESGPPDILVIILDALRAASLPMYGCPRNTAPFLEHLSQQSTLFERCYASAPWTKPAVTGILTGQSCLEHRITRPKARLPEEMPTFPKVLKKYGYQTGYFTANGMISEGYGAEKHFDRVSYEPVKGHDGEILIEEFEDWLDEIPEGPIMAYLHFFQPHGPYNPPRKFIDASLENGFGSDEYLRPEHHEVDIAITSLGIMGRIPYYQARPVKSLDPLRYLSHYEAAIMQGDTLVEKLFSRWRKSRGRRRTLSFITADHGETLGEHGFFCHHGIMLSNTILHVPLIIHDSRDPTSRVVKSPVSHLDFANTILRMAGSQEAIGTQGQALDLKSDTVLNDTRCLVHQTIPAGDGVQHHGEIGFAVTRGPWRLVYNDCPTCGNANLLQVRCGEASPGTLKRVPMHIPSTAIALPIELLPGVVLDRFGLHTPYVETGKAYGYSGRLQVETGLKGSLSFRLGRKGCEPLQIGVFDCRQETVSFKGQIPVLEPLFDTASSEPVFVEAQLKSDQTKTRSAPHWQRLVTFPLHTPQAASPFLHLVGVEVTPQAACRGDAVQAIFIWQCDQKMKSNPQVSLGLIDKTGRTVWQRQHAFFAPFFEEEEKIKPKDIFHAGFRFEDTQTIRVPEDLSPGEYRFFVKVENQEPREVTAGCLEVVDDPKKAFQAVLERDAGLENYRITRSSDRFSGGDLASADLDRFQQRFPQEGQPFFLRSLTAADPAQIEKEIKHCLTCVPYHRAALSEAAQRPWGQEYLSRHTLLTPDHPSDFKFSDLFLLYGFDLERSPDDRSLYFSLYWEGLARTRKSYTAELIYYMDDKEKARKQIWWFPGTGIRPTNTWKLGEALKETIHLPVTPDKEKFNLILKIYSHWDFYYTGRRDKNYLSVLDGKKPSGLEANLGAFSRSGLPVAEEDLLERKRRDPMQYQLYNLVSDPLEDRNQMAGNPKLFDVLKKPLVDLLEAGDLFFQEAGAAEAQPEDEEMSQELLEQLKNLGYVK